MFFKQAPFSMKVNCDIGLFIENKPVNNWQPTGGAIWPWNCLKPSSVSQPPEMDLKLLCQDEQLQSNYQGIPEIQVECNHTCFIKHEKLYVKKVFHKKFTLKCRWYLLLFDIYFKMSHHMYIFHETYLCIGSHDLSDQLPVLQLLITSLSINPFLEAGTRSLVTGSFVAI